MIHVGVGIPRELPAAQILDLDELRAARLQVLQVLIEDRHDVLGELALLGVVRARVLEVDVEREVGRAGTDAHLQRLIGQPAGDVVHLAEPAGDAAADLGGYRRPAPVVHPGGLAEVFAAGLDPARDWVRQLALAEAAEPLVPVPDERPDAAAVLVEVHLPVGHDVESRELLVLNAGRGRVAERLEVLLDLPPLQEIRACDVVLLEPARLGIGPDHGRREDRVGHFRRHAPSSPRHASFSPQGLRQSSSIATARTGEPWPPRIRNGKPKNVNRRPATSARFAKFS